MGVQTNALAAERRGRLDHVLGNHPVADNSLVVVDVIEKQVQGGNALAQAPFQLAPFGVRQNPRDDIEGNDPLGPLAVPVNVEGDPHSQHRAIGGPLPPLKIVGRQAFQMREQDLAFAARQTGRLEEFVVEVANLIGGEWPPHYGIRVCDRLRTDRRRAGAAFHDHWDW